jgi:hypothetical protein
VVLININALDGFSIAILGHLVLALWATFRDYDLTYSRIAGLLALVGATSFISTRAIMVTGTLTLCDLFSVAKTEMVRASLLAVGWAVTSIARGTPETFGFLLMAIAGFLFSLLILRTKLFKEWVGYLGCVALLLTLANQLLVVIAPSLAPVLMILNGLAWFGWWVSARFSFVQMPVNQPEGP